MRSALTAVDPEIRPRADGLGGNTVKRIVGIVLAAVHVVGLGAFFVVRSAEDKVTDDMLSRTARFAIPADWKLTDETVRPERFMCISTNPCPSLFRRWDAGRELTDSDVTAVLAEVGVEMKADRPCERRSNVNGNSPVCTSSGSDGELHYSFTVWSPGPGGPQDAVLEVRAL
jgi:hypothetical protein